MKILVIGGGGREHAIVWKLAQSEKCTEIFCAPGNAGISEIAKCMSIKATDIDALLDFAKENGIDFTVVGPDDALALGIVDKFEEAGLKIYGPRQKAAIIESSKAFSKEFMKRHGIKTAKYEIFDNYDEAIEYANAQKYPLVVKADGLALGKGVIIANNVDEAVSAIGSMMLSKKFGNAGSSVVIEEFLVGTEVTVLAFCDGENIVPMASSQDYKKIHDGDLGLNTGGMGSFSPSYLYDETLAEICMDTIFKPTVEALKNEGRAFKGTLYFGLIITNEGPKVIEYNARFGDPETQPILTRLDSDLLEIMLAVCEERLESSLVSWKKEEAVCLILASRGYPEDYKKGFVIRIDESLKNSKNLVIFHAGTEFKDGEVVTSGGRVLNIVSVSEDVESARQKVYEVAKLINFENMHYRKDIAINLKTR